MFTEPVIFVKGKYLVPHFLAALLPYQVPVITDPATPSCPALTPVFPTKRDPSRAVKDTLLTSQRYSFWKHVKFVGLMKPRESHHLQRWWWCRSPKLDSFLPPGRVSSHMSQIYIAPPWSTVQQSVRASFLATLALTFPHLHDSATTTVMWYHDM